jgi:hypothetical protein
MPKVLCIYHASCADGLGAAWAVRHALGPEVEFVPAKYGDQHELLTPAECIASGNCPSQEDIPCFCNICDGGLGYCKKCHRAEIQLDQPCGIPSVEGRDILIVDFSYPLPVLRAMAAEARSVLVLDHHASAQADLKSLGTLTLSFEEWLKRPDLVDKNLSRGSDYWLAAIFDFLRSGAGLTWDYLHPGVARPRIIDLIEDRDLWKFRFGDETRAFHAVLTSYNLGDLPTMFERLDTWQRMYDDERSLGQWSRYPMAEGRAILRANAQAVASAVADSRRTIRIAGHVVPCANVPHSMASDAGHLLCAELVKKAEEVRLIPTHTALQHYFSATYHDGADGRRHFSLRSPEGGADVGQVALNTAIRLNVRERAIHSSGTQTFTGGGHAHAAGFDAPLSWLGEDAP